VWLYFRFNLSHRRCAGPFIEDLLAQRRIIVTHGSIRLWCNKFGSKYAARLRKEHRGYGDTFFIDEVFIKIDGKQRYLWRAVDKDGEVVDVHLVFLAQGSTTDTCFYGQVFLASVFMNTITIRTTCSTNNRATPRNQVSISAAAIPPVSNASNSI